MLKRIASLGLIVAAACATEAPGPAVVTPIAAFVATQEISPEQIEALDAVCSAEASDSRRPVKYLRLAGGMGTGGFAVDTTSKEAQDWFDYGLALSHGFYHEDAKAAMKRAVEADPQCALCAWGLAWTLGPTLNYGIDEDDRVAALAAAEKAKALVKPGDAKAAALTAAMVGRYAAGALSGGPTNVLGGAKAGESKTEGEFGRALAKIAADYPDETELAVLAAHSLLIPVRGDDKSGLKPALALLEAVLKKRPDDTGAIHYYIHATEFDERPEDALVYAERLGRLAPAASHLVHMPAHTMFHAGLYEEAAVVNAKAIEADHDWIRAGGNPGAPKGKDGDLPMYYAHNLAFGLAGSLMAGDAQLALKYASHAVTAYPIDGAAQRGDPTPRTWVALALYAPKKMLALPVSPRTEMKYPLYRAYARGEALLRQGDAAGARVELETIRRLMNGKDSTAEGQVAAAVLAGRIAMAQDSPQSALRWFEAAAKTQEADLVGYMDPPQWWYPVRRSVAAAWLKAGEYAKAEREAAASLKAWKKDPLALWVLGKAQLALGHLGDGEATLEEARKLWRGDFDSITVDAI